MAVGSIILPSDVGRTGKHQPTRTKTDTDSILKHFPRVIIESNRQTVNEIEVTTPRTLGAGSGTGTHIQNIFALSNEAAAVSLLAVRRLSIQLDVTALLTAVAPVVKVHRMTSPNLPGGGTALTKVLSDTAPPPAAATTIARAATASDGGAATAITASSIGAAFWSQFTMRTTTTGAATGQMRMEDEAVIPRICEDEPIFLRPGEALLVDVTATPGTSNPATNHWVVNCMFEEFTEF